MIWLVLTSGVLDMAANLFYLEATSDRASAERRHA